MSKSNYRVTVFLVISTFLYSNGVSCYASQQPCSCRYPDNIYTLNNVIYKSDDTSVTLKGKSFEDEVGRVNVAPSISNSDKSGGYFDYRYDQSDNDSWFKHITKNNKKYGNFYNKPVDKDSGIVTPEATKKTKKIFICILFLFILLLFSVYVHKVRQKNKR